jgi:pimeloyl-ACP methyl ester carboxylesterase
MSIALRMSGTGPAVVFLHGCPTPWDVLEPIARKVAEHACAIEVALPGYGTSEPLSGPWGTRDLHQALGVTLHAHAIRRASLVGFSGGAYHALALACHGIVEASCLVLLGGFATFTAEERAGYRQLSESIARGDDLRALMGPRSLSTAFRAKRPECVATVEGWFEATSPSNLSAEFAAFAHGEDLTPRLPGLTAPILARVGSEDVAMPCSKSEAIVDAAPSAQIEIVPGVGHALMLEDPEGTLDAVMRGLRLRA